MFTGPVGSAEFFYWPLINRFEYFYWPGASASLSASSPVSILHVIIPPVSAIPTNRQLKAANDLDNDET